MTTKHNEYGYDVEILEVVEGELLDLFVYVSHDELPLIYTPTTRPAVVDAMDNLAFDKGLTKPRKEEWLLSEDTLSSVDEVASFRVTFTKTNQN